MPKAAPKHRPATTPPRRHCPPEQSRQARRTLATNCAAWRKLRASVLSAEPLCRECSKRGIVRAANHVDHENGDPSNNDPSNLQPLCAPCHSRKTAAEDGGFGNRRKTHVRTDR
jgi:5-methylcytosine-specific restriction protein A